MQTQMQIPQMAMSTPISQLPEYTSNSGSQQQSSGMYQNDGGQSGGVESMMGGVMPASEFLGMGSSFANF